MILEAKCHCQGYPWLLHCTCTCISQMPRPACIPWELRNMDVPDLVVGHKQEIQTWSPGCKSGQLTPQQHRLTDASLLHVGHPLSELPLRTPPEKRQKPTWEPLQDAEFPRKPKTLADRNVTIHPEQAWANSASPWFVKSKAQTCKETHWNYLRLRSQDGLIMLGSAILWGKTQNDNSTTMMTWLMLIHIYVYIYKCIYIIYIYIYVHLLF